MPPAVFTPFFLCFANFYLLFLVIFLENRLFLHGVVTFFTRANCIESASLTQGCQGVFRVPAPSRPTSPIFSHTSRRPRPTSPIFSRASRHPRPTSPIFSHASYRPRPTSLLYFLTPRAAAVRPLFRRRFVAFFRLYAYDGKFDSLLYENRHFPPPIPHPPYIIVPVVTVLHGASAAPCILCSPPVCIFMHFDSVYAFSPKPFLSTFHTFPAPIGALLRKNRQNSIRGRRF